MSIKQLPEEERPIEKALHNGIGTLSNGELLALILRTGSSTQSAMGLAESIMRSIDGGLAGLVSLTPQELMGIRGIGRSKACAVAAVGELAKRIHLKPIREKYRVDCASDVAGFFMEELRYEKKEHFRTLMLNAKGVVIGSENISTGGLTSTAVHPREVFSPAIRKNASTVVLVHNHPSGDPTPSDADVELTKRIQGAGRLIGIKVLDHVIIGDGRYVSLMGEGYIKED
ncbi:MAG: DNA repair protein RadC [Firmicutes bacterium]|nr:DNA repair protein RadC [Bacillota bacterium]